MRAGQPNPMCRVACPVVPVLSAVGLYSRQRLWFAQQDVWPMASVQPVVGALSDKYRIQSYYLTTKMNSLPCLSDPNEPNFGGVF